MAPKAHRTGHLRAHSRNSSTTKLGGNLAFTQNPAAAKAGTVTPGPTKKSSSSAGLHEPHTRAAPQHHQRTNSAVRVHQLQQSHGPPKRSSTPTVQKVNGNTKSKSGFMIQDDDDDEASDGDWVSSESGAATPNHEVSDSDEESMPMDTPRETNVSRRVAAAIPPPPALSRADTLRAQEPSRKTAEQQLQVPAPKSQADTKSRRQQHDMKALSQPEERSVPPDHTPAPASRPPAIQTEENVVGHVPTTSRTAPSSPRPHRSKQSRPPSMHSIASQQQPLRPHPLIRGHSYGQGALVSRPVALTAVQDAVQQHADQNESSPTATTTSTPSPSSSSPRPLSFISAYSPTKGNRRTSISSSHSTNTLPVPQQLYGNNSKTFFDHMHRTRTLSTASSSAALSSLVQNHHPFPSSASPTSVTPQLVCFFPAQNPHAHIDEIHPLLPGPYLTNHLTTLASKTPLRESYDRVMAAKRRTNPVATRAH